MLDHDAAQKLAKWFEDRWNDRWCIDISDELVADHRGKLGARRRRFRPTTSTSRWPTTCPQEARAGLSEFRIPREFGDTLFEFQTAAVKIAAHHLNKRGGVLIGDVVGLGKTLMATALARIFEDDHGTETLIICPKNLVPMWEDYRRRSTACAAKVLSISRRHRELPDLRRYRAGAHRREPQPAQSRGQALPGDPGIHPGERQQVHPALGHALQQDLPRPVQPASPVRRRRTRTSASARSGCCGSSARPSSSAATSAPSARWPPSRRASYADDWRELMRLYMVRRTRSFIQDNYADDRSGQRPQVPDLRGRHALLLPDARPEDGASSRSTSRDPDDQYARLYADDVVDAINALNLPRYGLGNYVAADAAQAADAGRGKAARRTCRARASA